MGKKLMGWGALLLLGGLVLAMNWELLICILLGFLTLKLVRMALRA